MYIYTRISSFRSIYVYCTFFFVCLFVCLFVFVFNIRRCKMPDAVVCHCTITNAQVNLYVALALQCYLVDTYSFGNDNNFLVLVIATYRSLAIVIISISVRHLPHAAACLTGSQQSHVIMLPVTILALFLCWRSAGQLSPDACSSLSPCFLVDTILFYFKINPPTPAHNIFGLSRGHVLHVTMLSVNYQIQGLDRNKMTGVYPLISHYVVPAFQGPHSVHYVGRPLDAAATLTDLGLGRITIVNLQHISHFALDIIWHM